MSSEIKTRVPGIEPGQLVYGRVGRCFKVLRNNEFVMHQNGDREGPYCRLQAMDDRSIEVIYPRDWYALPGETRSLFA